MSTKKVLSQKSSSPIETDTAGLQKILNAKSCGAFLVRGDRTGITEKIKQLSTSEESLWLDLNTLGIDDVRSQISQADFSVKESRLVVFSFYHITLEAQNALLKFLEEPPKNTTILLLTGNSTVLLPTIISRISICDYKDNSPALDNARLFLQTTPVSRMNLSFIKKILLVKIENSESLDKEGIQDFIQSVMSLIESDDVSKLTTLEVEMLQNCLSLTSRLKQNGASAKQILEYVSLACRQR